MIINQFKNEYGFLSNFAPCLNWVQFEGELYSTAEHAYQAAKTLNTSERFRIKACKTPGQAKRLGKQITLRRDWNKLRVQTMYSIVLDKFTRNQDLAELLLMTQDAELIEGNTWGDTFWGVYNGEGKNNLGRILMNVRHVLRFSREEIEGL